MSPIMQDGEQSLIKKTDGTKELNVVIETKDVPDAQGIRGDEKEKIECAQVFFSMLSQNGYPVRFDTQFQDRKILQVIKDVLNGKEA